MHGSSRPSSPTRTLSSSARRRAQRSIAAGPGALVGPPPGASCCPDLGAQRAGDGRGVHRPGARLPEDARQRSMPFGAAHPLEAREQLERRRAERVCEAREQRGRPPAIEDRDHEHQRLERSGDGGASAAPVPVRPPGSTRVPSRERRLHHWPERDAGRARSAARRCVDRGGGSAPPRRRSPRHRAPGVRGRAIRPPPGLLGRRAPRGDRGHHLGEDERHRGRLEPLDRPGHQRPELVSLGRRGAPPRRAGPGGRPPPWSARPGHRRASAGGGPGGPGRTPRRPPPRASGTAPRTAPRAGVRAARAGRARAPA